MRLFFLLFFSTFLVNSQTKKDILLAKTQTLKQNSELIDIYLELAKEYENDNLETAFLWVNKSAALSDKLNYKKGLYKSLKKKGQLYYQKSQQDSALAIFYKIFERGLVKSAIDSADIYSNIGIAHQANGEVDKALEVLNLALKIYDIENSDSGLLSVLVNMANCFYETGNANQALNYSEQAYKLALKTKDTKNLPITILNYSMLLLDVENDTSKVDKLLSKLKADPFVKRNPDILSTYYQNMAVFYFQTNKLTKAETNYKLALETTKTYKSKVDSGIYIGLAQVYLKKGEYKLAIAKYHEAIKNGSKNTELRLAYTDLANVYTQTKQIDSASHYWSKSFEIMKTLEQERTNELLLKSKNNLDIIQKENQIQLLEAQRETSILKNTITNYIITGLTILLFLLAIIAFLIVKQKKKLLLIKEDELKLKKQNLVSLSLHINQKNQVLKDFEQTISENEITSPKLYNDVKKALKNSLKIDEDWKEFELYFNDLYSGFYDTLKTKFPALTNNELRICSLAKLRFSLKEISNTLFLSVDSVKSARYRIRTKLELDTTDDLSDFLNNL